MEVYASHGPIMLFEAVYKGSHAVVPQLNSRRVEGDEDPWSLWVESNAFCAGGLGLELGEHRGGGGGHVGWLGGSLSSCVAPFSPVTSRAEGIEFDRAGLEAGRFVRMWLQ